MKNLFLLLATLISLSASAQITLENTYPGVSFLNSVLFSANGTKYYSVTSTSGTVTVKIYNTNHTEFKTITYSIPPAHNYHSSYCLSDHLFNNTDDLEIVLSFHNSGTGLSKTFVVNESGAELFDLGNTSYVSATYVDGAYKLICNTTSASQYRVYSLPGSLPCGHCSGAAGIPRSGAATQTGTAFAMPNPAGDNVTIAYTLPQDVQQADLTIYAADGRAIHTQSISKNYSVTLSPAEGSATVPMSNHSPGLYTFTITAPSIAPITGTFTH